MVNRRVASAAARIKTLMLVGTLALLAADVFSPPAYGQSAGARPVATSQPETLEEQIASLRRELEESRKLRGQVTLLQAEVSRLKPIMSKARQGSRPPPRNEPASTPTNPQQAGYRQAAGSRSPYQQAGYAQAPAYAPNIYYGSPIGPNYAMEDDEECVDDTGNPPPPQPMPVFASYGYNFGGGFTQLGNADESFTVKLQNQLTLDGTFYNQPNMPTAEKGFNIPFYRTYLYGNITNDWDYQIAVQGFLGEFNVLDAWVNYTLNDEVHFRAGRMLSPFLYEYWAFSPAWEPVITNSMLFQVAGKRQMGGMFWGRLDDNHMQYQAGIFTGIEGGFYDLDRSVDFLGSLTFTPWKGDDDWLDSLGFGMSVQTGMQNYALNSGNVEAFINGAGEPTLNFNYINSTGIPFFQYNDDVSADGMRTKFAPHLFWFGRLSFHAEYIWQQRRLADSNTVGTTILQGYQSTVAYLITGESRTGDGLGGWATVDPRSPFSPSKGEYGPGAWELAFQYSTLDVGTDNFHLGFADPDTSTNRIWQTMLGVNWWPNRYTRLSFDWMHNKLNRPVPTGDQLLSSYDTYWTRLAMFF